MTISNTKYRWFSIPIEAKGIPSNAEFVPVSLHVDFGAILEHTGQSGVVDERTLKLYRIKSDGNQIEEPLQFSSDIQPRQPGRQLPSGITENVSWAGAWDAGEISADLNVSGNLTWIAQASPDGISQYKLIMGVPTDGIFVQVPFLPNNLRNFDGEGRATPVKYFPRMQLRPQWPLDGVVNILCDDKLLTTYHIGPTDDTETIRRPYFCPVNGPDGIGLTELGKPHDPTGSHAHHYSLWIAHANVGGSDFWSEKGGIIRHEQSELMEDGPVFARLIQRTSWEKRSPENLPKLVCLRELRKLTFYSTPEDFYLIDVELEISPGDPSSRAKELPALGKTPFGFLAARVAQSMTVFDGGGEIINSAGQRNEQYAHWQNAAWIDQSGPISPEKWGGIAIFDHPDNPGHPAAWHCRNDGWAGASFNLNREWNFDSEIPLNLRYRVHLHRHDASAGKVACRYEEYSCEPEIRPGKAECMSF